MKSIILIFVLAVIFYFVVSPYQNCRRGYTSGSTDVATLRCARETSW